MIKIFSFHFFIGVLINVIVAILSSIAFWVLASIFASLSGFMFPLIVVLILGIIAGCIGIRLAVTSESLGLKTYIQDDKYYSLNVYSKMWKNRIDKNRSVKLITIIMVLLSYIAIALLFIWLASNQFSYCSNIEEKSGKTLPYWLLALVLSESAGFWIIYWIYLMKHYISCSCRCGKVMSRIEEKLLDYQYYDDEQSKTKSTYGVIGEVFDGDKKVGEVRGKTGSNTIYREVHSSSWTSKCRCVYCNRVKEIKDGRVWFSDWK